MRDLTAASVATSRPRWPGFGAVIASLAVAASGSLAQDSEPALDPCVVAAQKANAGTWDVVEQRRLPGPALRVDTRTTVERNVWRDPDTLILQSFEAADAPVPSSVTTEVLTPTGLELTIRDGGEERAFFAPVRFDCAFDPDGRVYTLIMDYEADFGGAAHAYHNEVRFGPDAGFLVRHARPTGSDGAYFWVSSLTAQRRSRDGGDP